MRAIGTILFLALTVSPLASLDVELNGKPWKSWTDGELRDLAYPVPSAAGLRQGIALLEILPLMATACRLVAYHPGGAQAWEFEGIADSLSLWYLLDSDSGWELAAGDRKAAAVSRLSLTGDILEDRTLQVWVSWEGVDLLKREIARFSRLHGCDISVVEVPQIESKLLAVIRRSSGAAGSFPMRSWSSQITSRLSPPQRPSRAWTP